MQRAALARGSARAAEGPAFRPALGRVQTRPRSGLSPLAQPAATLFKSLMAGEQCLHGFTNRDIRARQTSTQLLRSCADDSVEGKCKGWPVLQAPACPRPDRQDCAHAPPASHQLRPQRHGHFDVRVRAPLPQRLLRCRPLIIFPKDKELMEKESILQHGSTTRFR